MEKIQDIRPYEISLWTLQDSFITVLKWGNFDQKGQVQDSILTQDVDGTQELTFTIPMYLSNPDELGNNKKIENPIWYNTRNGNLMVNLRKIKVIINKEIEEEREIYEFIISKITERHEKEQLYCDVSCEGLAFNELGKIGYKISLSSDDYYNDYEQWFNSSNSSSNSEPKQTIQYWNNKFLSPYPSNKNEIISGQWYYQIQISDESGNVSNKIYEEEHVSSWKLNNNSILVPNSILRLKEKERPIDIEESNIYNITQKIAEIFGVFCKYEYEYDDNFHIIARKIIYYNNFIEENNGHMDITYPYHTSKIVREADSTDLVTKMFVRIQDDGSEIPLTIMNAEANKSKEDYILNFNYLHDLGIISEEQYNEIGAYEQSMYSLNKQLNQLNKQLDIISNKILKETANQSIAQKEILSANQQLNNSIDHLTNLGDNKETAIVKVNGFNAKPLILMQDKDTGIHYIQMPFVGIIPTSIKLRVGNLKYNYINEPLEDSVDITDYLMEYDEYGNLNKIINLPSKINNIAITTIWLECEYLPYTYWINVKNYWEISLADAQKREWEAEDTLNQLNLDKENKEKQYEQLCEQKKEKIKKFEQMMGPALREGYWQPDDYYDYNNRFYINFSGVTNTEQVKYNWDNNLLDGEDEVTFKQGNKFRQYLMIDLSNLNQTELNYIKDYYDDLYFCYYDYKILELNRNLTNSNSEYFKNISNSRHTIHIDGGCKFGFINKIDKWQNATRIPVLIITDSTLFTNEQLQFFRTNQNSDYYSSLKALSYDQENEETIEWEVLDDNDNRVSPKFSYSKYIFSLDNLSTSPNVNQNTDLLSVNSSVKREPVNLRITINSLSLNTSSSELMIKLDGKKILKEYEDYYIIKDYDNVYITIKPQILFKLGKFPPKLELVYSLSNTETAIYLDALQVAKENAYPKVSYEVDLSIYQPNIVRDIYKKLSHIVHINDTDLKFKEIQGYISRIELDLDHPWQDKIEVKNYKTKFEDLFSTIIASTEAMKKNEYRYGVAAAGFNMDGSLNNKVISEIFNNKNDNENNINIIINEAIEDKLGGLFNEAGMLLSTAGNSLINIQSLSSSNANILSEFYMGVQNGFGSGIDYTVLIGDNKSVSAVRINKDEGIFIGSDKKIILSSTNAIKDNNGNYIGDPNISNSGANVELSPQRLLMGVSNLSSDKSGAVDITSEQILLAVGNNISNLQITSKITDSTNLSGIQIKNNYIGLASGTGVNRSIVSIEPTGITLGSTADLYINTNNFKLQTNAKAGNQIGNTIFAIGTNLSNITANTDIESLSGDNDNINFLVNKDGAYIKGRVYATSGRFKGNIVATGFTLEDSAKSSFDTQISTSSTIETIQTNLIAINVNANNANTTANSAKATATAAANAIAPLTVNGLSSGVWNEVDYGVILGNNSNSKPMLIGSNSGITIAGDTGTQNGEAIVLKKSGIALHGSTIDLTTVYNTEDEKDANGNPIKKRIHSFINMGSKINLETTETIIDNNGNRIGDDIKSVITMSGKGINLASTAEINMETGGKFNISADSGIISLGDYFTIDSEGNLKCKSITCETINGKIASNTTTEYEEQEEVTRYNSGNKIWFSGAARTIQGTDAINCTIYGVNINLDNEIEENTSLQIKLGFADSMNWFFVSGISISLGGNYSASATVFWDSDSRTGKIGQGKTSVTSENFTFGRAVPKGQYSCSITITFPYSYSPRNTWYPNQSYIQIV